MFQLRRQSLPLVAIAANLCAASIACAGIELTTNFESGIPSQVNPGVAQLNGVQGFAGLGPIGRRFSGSFLRSPTGNTVTVTLTNLPPHDLIDLRFLFAAIDSLDGTGSTPPQGDFLRVRVDGQQVFRESFANATEQQIQSYVSAPGVQLARFIDLGFSGPGSYYRDSAYDMGMEPRFQNLPHTASTLTIDFLIEGPGIQDLNDESWALDELTIELKSNVVCDSIDFNNDTSLFDPQDIEAFLSVYSEGPCIPSTATCSDIDFNNDTSVFDPCDISSFLLMYSEGPCTPCGQ
ncbi:MAG: hypothetical protein U0640_09120 [Phycisphaerales bacterium]